MKMKAKKIPKAFYEETRIKLLNRLDNFSAIFFFAGEAPYKSGDDFYPFTPNRNFLYLTGIDAPKLIYFAYKTFGKTEEMLFIERRNDFKEKWVGPSINKKESFNASGIEKILCLDEFDDTVRQVIFTNKIANVYLDLENRFAKYTEIPALRFYEEFRKNYPAIKLKNGGKLVYAMRGIKDEREIEQIQQAIDITGLAIDHIINSIEPGMYEYQIESCFDFALKFNGTDRAFESIIAGGKNATILHYCKNNCLVDDEALVLMDFGALWNYYSADITRTIPISGKFTKRQKELYNIVLNVQLKVIEAVRPGVTILELNDLIIDYYKTALKEVALIDNSLNGKELTKTVEKYYWHKIGHSLGLDTHDCSPERDIPLEAGMVITVEPGLYVGEEGIGIRIEDDILVTKDGYKNLSAAIPKTVSEIEEAFKHYMKAVQTDAP